jgi:hypothetical protein
VLVLVLVLLPRVFTIAGLSTRTAMPPLAVFSGCMMLDLLVMTLLLCLAGYVELTARSVLSRSTTYLQGKKMVLLMGSWPSPGLRFGCVRWRRHESYWQVGDGN